MSKIFHILNPSQRQEAWVRNLLDSADLGLWAWVSRDHPAHTETLLDWALRESMQRLVVWGGDGTFHRVVQGLWERKALDKMELALVPVGTCNDLARFYGLSKAFWHQWHMPYPRGRLAPLFLSRLRWKNPKAGDKKNGQEVVFINNAGFGRPHPSFEKKEPAWKVLFSFKPLRLKAHWADGELQGLYYMMLACNAPYFSGGLHFEKDISPEEGLLRFYFLPARSKLRLAARLLRGRLGWTLGRDKTTKITTNEMTIEAEPAVSPQADGEPPPENPVTTLEFKVLPQRVQLWVPAS